MSLLVLTPTKSFIQTRHLLLLWQRGSKFFNFISESIPYIGVRKQPLVEEKALFLAAYVLKCGIKSLTNTEVVLVSTSVVNKDPRQILHKFL